MLNKIIAIVGLSGAGKSEAVKYLVKKGFARVYFGQATFDEIKKRGLETNAETEKKIREDLRKKYGMGAYATLSMKRIDGVFKKNNVVIESMYSWDEFKIVNEKYKSVFKVIAICANKELRHQRLTSRKELKNGVERKFSMQDAINRDFLEIDNLNVGGPIAIADYTIVNEGSKQELFEKLDKILEKIQK